MMDVEIIERVAKLEEDVVFLRDTNEQFRDEVREEVHELKKQNEAIYKIAASVEVLAHDMKGLRTDVREVKDSVKETNRKVDSEIGAVRHDQEELSARITQVNNKEASKLLTFWNNTKDKLAWLVIGGFAAYLLYYLFPFLK